MYAAYNGYPQVVKLLLGRQTCHVLKHWKWFSKLRVRVFFFFILVQLQITCY